MNLLKCHVHCSGSESCWMDPYMLDRVMEKEARGLFGKGKKEAYSEDIDLWSIGCTLVFIACNRCAFLAEGQGNQKNKGLKELFAKRDLNHILGSKTGNGISFSDTFGETSPMKNTASPSLQEIYIDIIRECFKPLGVGVGTRDYSSISRKIDMLKNEELYYMIDINQGFGEYDIGEKTSNDSTKKIFEKEYIDHYSKALKFPVPVKFVLESKSTQPESKTESRFYTIDPSTTDKGTPAMQIKSQCTTIRAIYSQTERTNFDITMLKHLCLIECNINKSMKKYKEIEEERMAEYNKVRKEIETCYMNIPQVYKDVVQLISREKKDPKSKTDLKPLLNRCNSIEKDLGQKFKKLATIANARREGGLMKKLSSLIVEEIKLDEHSKF